MLTRLSDHVIPRNNPTGSRISYLNNNVYQKLFKIHYFDFFNPNLGKTFESRRSGDIAYYVLFFYVL